MIWVCSQFCYFLVKLSFSFSCVIDIIFKFFIYLFLAALGLVAACGLSLVGASRGYFSLWCMDFSLRWLLFVVEHGL